MSSMGEKSKAACGPDVVLTSSLKLSFCKIRGEAINAGISENPACITGLRAEALLVNGAGKCPVHWHLYCALQVQCIQVRMAAVHCKLRCSPQCVLTGFVVDIVCYSQAGIVLRMGFILLQCA